MTTARRLLAAATTLLALGALSAPAGALAQDDPCTGADATPTRETLAEADAAVRCLVDLERRAAGLAALRADDALASAARGHAMDMVARRFFDHIAPAPAPAGATLGERATTAGYDWRTVGENIAFGQKTPRAVMLAWMRSEGHCRNVLAGDFADIGVSATLGTPQGEQGVTWVQEFGTTSGAPPEVAGNGAADACPKAALARPEDAAAAGPVSGGGTPATGTTSSGVGTESTAPAEGIDDAVADDVVLADADSLIVEDDPAGLAVKASRTGRLVVVRGTFERRATVAVTTRSAGRTITRRVRTGADGRFRMKLRVRPGERTVRLLVRGRGVEPVRLVLRNR